MTIDKLDIANVEITPEMMEAGVSALCQHDLEIIAISEDEILSAVEAVLRAVFASPTPECLRIVVRNRCPAV